MYQRRIDAMRKMVCVVGGDMRQRQLAKLLEEDFNTFTVGLYEKEPCCDIESADIVIFPIPMSHDNVYINAPLAAEKIKLDEVLARLKKSCFVLGACLTGKQEQMLSEYGLHFEDYYKREELIIKNAIPTAEGAIEIALAEMPITLYRCRALVIGHGRVGKIMAARLKALGAAVTVSARRWADFAWIEAFGMTAVHTGNLEKCAGDFDLIINTAPVEVLSQDVLKEVHNDTLIIDLASKPGGVDMEAAKSLGKNVIWALALPGKTAPVTSGEIIREAVLNIIREREV